MKIIKVTCPSCGANLNLPDDSTKVFCRFCGGEVIVEDSRSEGYNQELGKMQARKDVHISLADTISELKKTFLLHVSSVSRCNSLKKDVERLNSEIKKIDTTNKYKIYLSYYIIVSAIMLILIVAKASFLTFLTMCFISLLLLFIMGLIQVNNKNSLLKELENLNQDITKLQGRIEDCELIINAHPEINIPRKYRNKRALDYIISTIRSQQANNVEHAIALYDSLLRDETAIKLQRAQIRLQKESLEAMQDYDFM